MAGVDTGAGEAQPSERWERIRAVELDDPAAAFTLTDRAARENGWSPAFARRAVEEYRRFAYLAVTAPHEVTPSDEVDQVWHLHLTHTRHYWGEWTEALGRPLHHGPTAGGKAAQERYQEAYAATLESYYQAFGEEPPEDLWPDPATRFTRPLSMQRVERGCYLLLPKAWVWRAVWVAVPTFTALSLFGEAAGPWGAWAADTWLGGVIANYDEIAVPVILFTVMPMIFSVLGWVVGGIWRWVRGPRRRRRADGSWSFVVGGDGDSGCSGCGD